MVDFVELIGTAVAAGAVGWTAHWWWARRSPRQVRTPATTDELPPSAAEAPEGAGAVVVPRLVGPPTAAAPDETEVLGLARRVLVHLSSLGRLGADEVARAGFTQEGIAAALGARQGTVSKVLGRLVAAGAVSVDRRHVSGMDRRRNVYRLTALGESVALDLRRRRR